MSSSSRLMCLELPGLVTGMARHFSALAFASEEVEPPYLFTDVDSTKSQYQDIYFLL